MRAQTSTEFLVLLSIILIGVVLVVVFMMDFSGSASDAQDTILGTFEDSFGIASYRLSPEGLHIHFVNNYAVPVHVQEIEINEEVISDLLPFTLQPSSAQMFTYYYTGDISTYEDAVVVTYCLGPCVADASKTYSFSGSLTDKYYTSPLDSKEILARYLIFYYDANENTMDRSRYAQHPQLIGNVSFVDGVFGKALSISESDQQIMINYTNPILDISTSRNFTFVFWADIEDGYDGDILNIISGDDFLNVKLTAGNNLRMIYQSQNVLCEETTTHVFSINQYMMLSFVYYDNKQNFDVFENGSYVESLGTGLCTTGSPVSDPNVYDIFTGTADETVVVDEIMFFERALTEGEVRSLYRRKP